MKRFMYLSIGVLCLMLAVVAGYHLGSQTAQAQAPEPIGGYRVVASGGYGHHFVMLSNGDLYHRREDVNNVAFVAELQYLGNYWDGAPVPTQDGTWGSIKAK